MTKEELLAILGDDSKKDAELSKILDFYNNSTTDIKKEEPKKEEPKEESKEEFKSDTKITATFAEFMQLINKMQEKENPKKKEEEDNNAEIFI